MVSLQKVKQSELYQKYLLSGKVFIIGFIALLLLIPGMMVKEMMQERQFRSEEAKREIHKMWSGKQTLIGPLLEVPYVEFSQSRGTAIRKDKYFYVLPQNLKIQSVLEPDVLRRGMFEAVVYTADVKLSGSFDLEGAIPQSVNSSTIDWDGAKILVSVSDIRGVKESELEQEEQNVTFRTHRRVNQHDGLEQTIASPFTIERDEEKQFSVNLTLKGSENFEVIPVGESTDVRVDSSWHSPSFLGQFLPDKREVGDEGFVGVWKISGLSRGFPQSWTSDRSVSLKQSELGVRLMMPVGVYSQALRVVSYCFLFVLCTFGAMFCAERISGVSIHILQYAVAGVAIVVFYVLLLSIAEQIAFALAYASAAAVIWLMIVWYVRSIIKHNYLTMALAGMLALMYGYFYVVLQCEDYALLMGSIGLVLIVGTVMYLTRDLHKSVEPALDRSE